MAQDTLPAPVGVEAVEGEVITPEEQAEIDAKRADLADLESVADSGIEALNSALAAGSVAASIAGLAIRRIQVRGLWKFAQDPDNDNAHFTNFGAYAKSRFGWNKTYGRLSQVTTAAVATAFESGQIGEEEYLQLAPKASGSSSGVKAIQPDNALRVTLRSLEAVQDKLATRMDSEPVKADKELMKVLRKVNNSLNASISDLDTLARDRGLVEDDEPEVDGEAGEE